MSVLNDPHDLERFVNAQTPVFASVLSELRAGRKQGHWMWFIFPQVKGLGHSDLAMHYGIASREEALAYLKHVTLGPRLKQCTELVNEISGRTIEQILGYPDNLKFRSCMTLFALVSPEEQVFNRALEKYFAGKGDPHTVERLQM